MAEAVIFDCDGVLVDSEIMGLEDTATFMRTKGFDWQAADLVRLFTGLRDDVFAAKLGDEYAKVLGRPPTQEEAAELFTTMIENRRRNRHQLQAVPGTAEMVQVLKNLPFKRAVASSTRIQYLNDKLTRFGLWDDFAPHAYSAELVDHGKPAPDIFLYAAEKIQADPARCIVIEDSANGVIAGITAGMTVWGFTGGGHCYDGHGDRLLEAGAVEIIENHGALRERLVALAAA